MDDSSVLWINIKMYINQLKILKIKVTIIFQTHHWDRIYVNSTIKLLTFRYICILFYNTTYFLWEYSILKGK